MSQTSLTRQGCLDRQERLREQMRREKIAAALILHPHHVHYFCGWWSRPIFQTVLLITPERSVLAEPFRSGITAHVDERVVFTGSRDATMVDDQVAEALIALQPKLAGIKTAVVDQASGALLGSGIALQDLGPILRTLKRTKLEDEISLLRHAIGGCEAAYRWARENLKPGLSELDMYASLQATAVREVGEPIGEFGNDFQSGGGGGAPRQRAVEAGELMPLDLGVVYRGYSADLCRTFCIGGHPSSIQIDAHQKCVEVLEHVAQVAAPGVSCRELHEFSLQRLNGFKGLSFQHHLGHGIGLFAHESPRLNKNWDDVLQVGDVFTCEPGLYGEALRGGVRVEDNFVITASGAQRLSSHSLDL